MGISNLVSKPLETSTMGSYNDTGNGDHSRLKKRKIPTYRQQKWTISVWRITGVSSKIKATQQGSYNTFTAKRTVIKKPNEK
ncbi:hypothetical protein AYI68_g241 [Smittium mucronatum]|uniref:Uncharacterized protein n=1 Tax=Smittium mucronatum TaxID=133383 RepID=A0A1R0H8W2_9FUNG|nr:hypothetical protein AYI68_g241 [Smittium mucronatum]